MIAHFEEVGAMACACFELESQHFLAASCDPHSDDGVDGRGNLVAIFRLLENIID